VIPDVQGCRRSLFTQIEDLGRTDGRRLIDRLVAKRDALAAGR